MRRTELAGLLVFVILVAGLLVVGLWGTLPWSADNNGQIEPAVRSLPTRVGQPSDSTSPAPTTTRAASTATPSGIAPSVTPPVLPLPTIQDLVACDATVDCGRDPAQTQFSEVTVCFRTLSANPEQRLRLLITDRNTPPFAVDDAAVVARSEPVAGSGAFTCHPVRAVRAPLGQRDYWLWVVTNGAIVAQQPVRLGP